MLLNSAILSWVGKKRVELCLTVKCMYNSRWISSWGMCLSWVEHFHVASLRDSKVDSKSSLEFQIVPSDPCIYMGSFLLLWLSSDTALAFSLHWVMFPRVSLCKKWGSFPGSWPLERPESFDEYCRESTWFYQQHKWQAQKQQHKTTIVLHEYYFPFSFLFLNFYFKFQMYKYRFVT